MMNNKTGLYLAPMEEVTGYTFRNTLANCFGYVDKYFTPFVTPNQNKILKTKEGRELIPEHNKGLKVVPQILTNSAEGFNDLAAYIVSLGYDEINVNCGCPSGTVVKKKKGSGILRDTELLDEFLEGIFAKRVVDRISVKTRLAYEDPEDFKELLAIFNKYPIDELIIHARVGKDMYNGKPRLEEYAYGVKNSLNEVCYNGDINCQADFNEIVQAYAGTKAVMIGRGAVKNPAIFREIRTGQKATRIEMQEFINQLYDNYVADFGAGNALFKMKEVWSYFSTNFTDIEKPLKLIRKTKEPTEYLIAVKEIFS